MAWEPKIAKKSVEVVSNRRPWVAVAEENAEYAVKLFAETMKNKRYPIKVRMEAATRLVMIAGATFRGEVKDGSGRPAANLPGANVTKLEKSALREVLRQLPEGSVVTSPAHIKPGESVVVLHDSEHSRKPAGHVTQAAVGRTITQDADAPSVDEEERVEAAKDFIQPDKPIELEPEPPPPSGPALSMLDSIWKKS